jgi:hypothetical protein
MFTARYALSPYIKQTRFVFKGIILVECRSLSSKLSLVADQSSTIHSSNSSTSNVYWCSQILAQTRIERANVALYICYTLIMNTGYKLCANYTNLTKHSP